VAAGGEHDRVGVEDRPLAGEQVERERPEAGPVGHEQLGDVLVVGHGHAQLGDLRRQRQQHRPAGPVARVAGPAVTVGAEESLVEAAVREAGERGAPVGQLLHGGRCLPRHDLDHARVGEEIPVPQGVGEVLLPGVLRVDRPEGGVDPASREHGMSVVTTALADDDDLPAGLVTGDGRAQPGGAGADHEDVGDAGAKWRSRHAVPPACDRPFIQTVMPGAPPQPGADSAAVRIRSSSLAWVRSLGQLDHLPDPVATAITIPRIHTPLPGHGHGEQDHGVLDPARSTYRVEAPGLSCSSGRAPPLGQQGLLERGPAASRLSASCWDSAHIQRWKDRALVGRSFTTWRRPHGGGE
jgi:hypothetical protein